MTIPELWQILRRLQGKQPDTCGECKYFMAESSEDNNVGCHLLPTQEHRPYQGTLYYKKVNDVGCIFGMKKIENPTSKSTGREDY